MPTWKFCMMIRTVFLIACAFVFVKSASWEKYIVGPASRDVRPVNITDFTGNVTNPMGLLSDSSGETVISRSVGENPPSVVIDFGMVTVGYLKIKFLGASTPNVGLRLAFSETLQFLTNVSDYTRLSITPGTDQVAVETGPYTWTNSPGCRNGTKVCSDGLHGFRYVRLYLDALDSDNPVTKAYGSVRLERVSLDYTAFVPTVDSFQGWFECSDEQLNQFWYSAVYTNDVTTDTFRATDVDPRDAASPSLEGKLVLFDGAKRDRDPYVGDIAVSGLASYLSHGDLSSVAAKNVLADLGDHQREDGWIPPASIFNYTLNLFDYPLWWIVSIWDYTLYTNDTTLIDDYYPRIVRVLDDYYPANTNTTSRLISKPTGYGDYAFVPRDGEVAYYNALYVHALNAAVNLATLMGNVTSADEWRARVETVSTAINDAFWDDSVGAFRNFKYNSSSHPQDANALSIVAGVANDTRGSSALKYLNASTSLPYGNAFMDDDSLVAGGSQRVYAFMSSFEIRARFEYASGKSAIDQIRRTYGSMLNSDPGTTFWEGAGANGSMYEGGFTSAAHGWSAGVVSLLTNYVLGLQLNWLDCSWSLQAILDGPEWAEGVLPTAYGPIHLRWELAGGFLQVDISPPEGCSGDVVVPFIPTIGTTITHNGVPVWRGGRAVADVTVDRRGRIILSNIGGGSHRIMATELIAE